jgi:hypothetical protein
MKERPDELVDFAQNVDTRVRAPLLHKPKIGAGHVSPQQLA